MQECFRAQKNAGRFEGSEKCRKVRGYRKMREWLRPQENTEGFEGSEKCRKI